MNCTYCDKPAAKVHQPSETLLCRFCFALLRAKAYKLIARQWLTHHPEEWVDDVAAYLEYLYTARK